MATTKGRLEKLLSDLNGTTNAEASAIISKDGLLMASDTPQGKDIHVETFAAFSAMIIGSAERSARALNKCAPERVVIETKEGSVIVSDAGSSALLVVMTGQGNGLEPTLGNVNRAAEEIGQIV